MSEFRGFAGVASIRPVEIGDVLGVTRIEESSFPSPWETEVFLQLAYNRGCVGTPEGTLIIMRVLVHHGEIIGYVVWEQHEGHAHLMNLAVSRDFRRNGYGTRLLHDSIQTMRGAGIRDMYLEVREYNTPARRLYESVGMKASGRIKRYYGNTDAIIYHVRF